MKKFYIVILIYILSACYGSGTLTGTAASDDDDISSPCQKRCEGWDRPENITSSWHCATEPVLNTDGSINIEAMSKSKNERENTTILNNMIRYFSDLYVNNDDKTELRTIFIPKGTIELLNIDMNEGVSLVGSPSGETKLVSKTSTGIIDLGVENNLSLLQLSFDGYAIKQDDNGGEHIIISDNIIHTKTNEPNLTLTGSYIEIERNYFTRESLGIGVLQGNTSFPAKVDPGLTCSISKDYGMISTTPASTSGLSTPPLDNCNTSYIKIVPDLINIDINKVGVKSTVVELQQFTSAHFDLHGEKGKSISCNVKWNIQDKSKAITKPFSETGKTLREIEAIAEGETTLTAELVSPSLSPTSSFKTHYITYDSNVFGKQNNLTTYAGGKLQGWIDAIDAKKSFSSLLKSIFNNINQEDKFSYHWFGNNHLSTKFYSNLFSGKAIEKSIHSINFCENDFIGNYFFGEYAPISTSTNDTDSNENLKLENGQYSSIFQNYLNRSTVITNQVNDLYIYFNLFDMGNVSGPFFNKLDKDKVKHNYIYNRDDKIFTVNNSIKSCKSSSLTSTPTSGSNISCDKGSAHIDSYITSDKSKISDLAALQIKLLTLFSRKEYLKNSKNRIEPENYPSGICTNSYNYAFPKKVISSENKYISNPTKEPQTICKILEDEFKNDTGNECKKRKLTYCQNSFKQVADEAFQGKVSPASIAVFKDKYSDLKVVKSYGCEKPLGYKKEDYFVFIGAHIFNPSNDQFLKQESAIAAFSNSFSDQYLAAMYTGGIDLHEAFNPSIPILFPEIKYTPKADFGFITNSSNFIVNIKKQANKTINNQNKVKRLQKLKPNYTFKNNSQNDTCSGPRSGWDVHMHSGASKFENSKLIIIQTNRHPNYSEVNAQQYGRGYVIPCRNMKKTWTYHNSLTQISHWIKDAKKSNKQIIILSEIFNATEYARLRDKYFDITGNTLKNDLLAWLYSGNHQIAESHRQKEVQGCDKSNTYTCLIRIGRSHEGYGLILSFDEEEKELRAYAVIDNLMSNIAPWITLDYKNIAKK